MVARRQAARARRERSRSERRAGEEGRVEAQDGAAHRDRSLRLQERPVRLSRQAARAPLSVRRRRQEGRARSRRGNYDERNPSWSPDGTKIAFISERGADPDRTNNPDIWVVDAKAGATPQQLTTFPGPDVGRPAWSPDGKWIAYLQGDEVRYYAYNLDKLAVVPSAGGDAEDADGGARSRRRARPVFSKDGSVDLRHSSKTTATTTSAACRSPAAQLGAR